MVKEIISFLQKSIDIKTLHEYTLYGINSEMRNQHSKGLIDDISYNDWNTFFEKAKNYV